MITFMSCSVTEVGEHNEFKIKDGFIQEWDTFTQRWFIVGPTSKTAAQQ